MKNQNNWDRKFMELALLISTWSKDPGRKVGCVIVGPNKEIRSTGYNGLPRGVNDNIKERYMRPAKYDWTEHSERNAIANAARIGVSTNNCSIYIPLYPCVECTRLIVQSGISTIVTTVPDFNDPKYGKSWRVAQEIFDEVKKTANPDLTMRFLDLKLLGLEKE